MHGLTRWQVDCQSLSDRYSAWNTLAKTIGEGSRSMGRRKERGWAGGKEDDNLGLGGLLSGRWVESSSPEKEKIPGRMEID